MLDEKSKAMRAAVDALPLAVKQMENVIRADFEANSLAALDHAHSVISGFASFAQKGKPIGNEPVQIYEDSQFWNKVKEMTDMQDRIKQLAVEAGLDADGVEITAPYTTINGDPMDITEQVTKLVQAVARECAQIAESTRDSYWNGDGASAASSIDEAIRARFGLEG